MNSQGDFFSVYGKGDTGGCMLGTTKLIVAGALVGQKGDWQKMLNVSVPNSMACPVIVSVRTEFSVDPLTGAATLGCPVVGQLQWGVGGAENQVEFDVPSPRTSALLFPATAGNQPMNNLGNGVQVFVSSSHISLSVRHDGNLSPLTNPGGDFIGTILPVKVLAFITPGTGTGHSAVERTIICAGGNTLPVPGATPLAAGGFVVVSIPPFSRSMRVQRNPVGTPLQLLFANNNGTVYREFAVPVNAEGPIPVDGWCQEVRIFNTAAVPINFMQAVFDVTPT